MRDEPLTYQDGTPVAFTGWEKATLLILASYYNDKRGYAWPKVERMADALGVHRTTVIRALKGLEEKRVIERARVHEPIDGHRIGTRYYVPWWKGQAKTKGVVVIDNESGYDDGSDRDE